MAQENVAEKAEKVIRNLATRTNQKTHKDEILLTTNQIRKFLTAVNLLANKVDIYKAANPLATKLSEDLAMEVQYLQVKLVYQIGREKAEKNVHWVKLKICMDLTQQRSYPWLMW